MTQLSFRAVELARVLIAFGANLARNGSGPSDTILEAIDRLDTPECRVLAVSRLFRTPSFPDASDPAYINAAGVCQTSLSPASLLARLHELETLAGRVRSARWGPRTLDLDLLAHGDAVCPDAATWARWRDLHPAEQGRRVPDQLILPHPRLQDRAFVLVPLLDIAPDWRHPRDGRSVRVMAASLSEAERSGIRPLRR